ncbi:hypothetical protein LCGC14_0397360 [marine sediment metagenome]|uniref:Tip attachment protein J domain-containing protein n=1 Tax=marine sediment metagenome TaxID=412755 RepID=A0A0F9W701_9ZZZZ
MATLQTLTLDVIDQIFGQTPLERPAVDRLTVPVLESTSTLFRFDLSGRIMWEYGSYAEFFDGTGTAGEVVQLMAEHDTPGADVPVTRAQRRSSAAARTAIGSDWTFDFSGGASDDLWTSSAVHGLSVGDAMFFTSDGGGATEWAIDIIYYAVTVPSTTTATLSTTKGGAALQGSDDTSGNWAAATPAYAPGAVFLKDPPFTHTEIQRAINETIDSDLMRGCWFSTQRTISPTENRTRYPANASDILIEKMYQFDTPSTSIGTTTFIFTGSAVEDEWTTSTAHGLSVGDMVSFSAVGTAPTEYALGVIYYVATVPTTLTFTLSANEDTTPLAGTANSSGTWTIQNVIFNYREFPTRWYEIKHAQASATDSTGNSILLTGYHDVNDTIYYSARTRPSSSDISSLPTEITNLIPWGAVARLTGGTSVRGRYAESAAQTSTVAYADAAWFQTQFEDMVDQYRNQLEEDVPLLKRWEYGPTQVG